MGSLSLFLKQNKKKKENVKYKATRSLCDAKGEPLEWEIKPLTTTESETIREECTYEVQVTGKPNQFRQKLNTSKYLAKMIASSVVFPDLYNKELQDSYGVMTPEELIKEMIDNSAEYNDFAEFIQKYNGFDEMLSDKVEEAKN